MTRSKFGSSHVSDYHLPQNPLIKEYSWEIGGWYNDQVSTPGLFYWTDTPPDGTFLGTGSRRTDYRFPVNNV